MKTMKGCHSEERSDKKKSRSLASLGMTANTIFFNKLLSVFSYVLLLQRFDFGKQAVPTQASLGIGGHRDDVRQFRAPAAGFLLAGHCGSALCAEFLH
jgi:hypothetical protein